MKHDNTSLLLDEPVPEWLKIHYDFWDMSARYGAMGAGTVMAEASAATPGLALLEWRAGVGLVTETETKAETGTEAETETETKLELEPEGARCTGESGRCVVAAVVLDRRRGARVWGLRRQSTKKGQCEPCM